MGDFWTKAQFMKLLDIKDDTFRSWVRGETRSGAKLQIVRVSHRHTYVRQKDLEKFLEDCSKYGGSL